MGPLSTPSRLMGLEKVGYDPKGGPPRNTGFCQDHGQVVPFSALLYEIIKALPCFETDSHHQGTSGYARGAKGLGPFVQRPVNDRRVGGRAGRTAGASASAERVQAAIQTSMGTNGHGTFPKPAHI
jgi:hypothetical protein